MREVPIYYPLLPGDTWQEGDFWSTSRGLEEIPARLVGTRLTTVNSRDIFLRLVGKLRVPSSEAPAVGYYSPYM